MRQGLSSLVHACHQASIDICRHDAALGELARSDSFQEEVDHTIGRAAQKDAVAYCALAMGIRDTLDEIGKLRVNDIADEITGLKDSLFKEDISEFLRELRNNLVHGQVVIPQWEISYGFESGNSTGSMMYHVDNLMQAGRWSKRSRNFISSLHGEKMSLSTVVRKHFKLLNDHIRDINTTFARNVKPTETDFFDIEDSHKRRLRRQWAKIMVGQLGAEKSPYDHLHKFFDPETVREILRRPRNSKEQVDLIIGLKAAEIDWDDDLRNMMYRIFGVTPKRDA